MSDPRELLEPSALIWTDDFVKLQENPPGEHEIHLSIAISLKRIADALWGTDDTSGLLQLLNPLDVRNNY